MNQFYKDLCAMAESILDSKLPLVTNLANLSALVYNELNDKNRKVNWTGFYWLMGDELVLMPFQGRVACTKIKMGRGVCGKAAAEKITKLVHNVHEFEDHIACDSASEAEIVIPLVVKGKLVGVFDLDALEVGAFTEEDQIGLEAIACILTRLDLDFTKGF